MKFKAWDNAKKEWLTDKETVYVNDEGGAFVLTATNYQGDSLDRVNVTIVWHIGMIDDNGKNIYAGDVVKGVVGLNKTRTVFAEIIFLDGGFRLKEIGFNYTYTPHCLDPAEIQLHNIEIIGNIYENPELLKP